ncbi:phosphoglycerate dehydrogenase [Oceanobacillus jeddahense]|uniref:Phosphoglycerate dehydrogenase n=1 Tax=Oceanobacillus jeddahense TaxID=1462527 RepID=A0ABY5JSA7_9BACI|nr:phosphoglycerate dehydrogenase [Oceanobacillus jeddahense]UUI02322.1 phosphoglycerate dehydrogenase [Oceanobacillus jeddahense]
MPYKVLVTPRSFGRHSNEPYEILNQFGVEVKVNPYGKILTEEQMIEEIKDVDGIIVGVDPLNKKVLQHAENLKVISKYGVGIDNIDMEYAKEKNIEVVRAMNANADAVADYTLALMMAVARNVVQIDKECRELNWQKITTVDVHKKTLGLIGLGNIGKKVVQRAKGFEMDILAYDLVPDEEYAEKSGIQYVNKLEEIFEKADFITLHLPLNEHTEHIVGREQLERMKSTAVLVNTARGGLIDEQALSDALQERLIWGAGIDVFESEPPQNKELLELDNIVIGSHCAASTVQAIDNMGIISSQNLVDLFKQSDK